MRYLTAHREAHRVFQRKFPVATPIDLVRAIEFDLNDLGYNSGEDTRRKRGKGSATTSATTSATGFTPGTALYAEYLETLPVARLGCHWYNVAINHFEQDRQIVERAMAPLLPPAWWESSVFYQMLPASEVDSMRMRFAKEVQAWSDEEREDCLSEAAQALAYRDVLLNMLV